MNNKTLCIISLIVVSYFLFLFLNGYITKINIPVLGVLQELLTIPALVVEFTLLFLTARRVIKKGFLGDTYLFTSFMSLFVGAVIIIGSVALSFLGYAV